MSTNGRFVVLEGIDGSGTSTQAELLVQRLEHDGIGALLTREPSDGPIGRLIRRALGSRFEPGADGPPRELDWSTLALLFAADRLDHVASVVEPALERGVTVVSDRYVLSSLVYQSLTAPDPAQGIGFVEAVNARALRPTLTIVLDVPAEVAERRRAARGGEAELFERSELQRRLAEGYARAEGYLPGERVAHVPATGSVDEVAERVLDAVKRLGA
jgi:dTMP kinase